MDLEKNTAENHLKYLSLYIYTRLQTVRAQQFAEQLTALIVSGFEEIHYLIFLLPMGPTRKWVTTHQVRAQSYPTFQC